MEKELKEILGFGYEVATAIGEKLGGAINDAIDKMFPVSDNDNDEKGGK